MNLSRRNGSQRDQGFTLIELLLVVIILGVLSTVVVVSVRGIRDRGGSTACESSRTTVRVSVESYYARRSRYPTSLHELSADFIEDADKVITAGPAPYTNTLEGGPGKWTFHYTFVAGEPADSFEITPCVMLT